MTQRTLAALIFCAGCGLAAAPLSRPLPPDNLERGLKLFRSGDFGEAARVLEQAASDFPDNPKAWTYLGLARLELDQFDRAVDPFRKAVELDPDFAEPRFGLGLALAHLGEVDAAIGELERAVELNPTHAYAHYHLGLAYNEKGKTDKSLLHLQRFAELEPDAPEAERVRALLARVR